MLRENIPKITKLLNQIFRVLGNFKQANFVKKSN